MFYLKTYFLILLWFIVISHESIPHHHPFGDASKTEFLIQLELGLNQKESSKNKEEKDKEGVLDNLQVIIEKITHNCKPAESAIPCNLLLQNLKHLAVLPVIETERNWEAYEKLKSAVKLKAKLYRAPPY